MVTVPVLLSFPSGLLLYGPSSITINSIGDGANTGTIVNEAGTYKVEPPNVTLPDISKLLEIFTAPVTFNLPLISILVALTSFIYALFHGLRLDPKLELLAFNGFKLPETSILVTLTSLI